MGAFWLLLLLAAYGLFGSFVHTLNGWLKDGWLSGLGVSTEPWVSNVPLLGKFGTASATAVVILLVAVALIYRFLSRPAAADYLIETEAEMRRSVWPSWKDTRSGAVAVVVTVGILLLFLLMVDALFLEAFNRILQIRITGS
ncbi:MAG: preprotein translocase subunit SecE [Planctomycetes bacterium]|nr:preprotein translocase subunit SecE [Planctomycetota bacterium]